MEVYMDLVMVLNFLVDFLLLQGTNRLAGFPAAPGRCAWAALLGAAYSGACMLPGFRFLGNLLWRCVFLGLMAVLAFGWDRSALKRGGIFLLLSMALGGIALSAGRNDFPALILCGGFCYLLCRISFGSRAGGREYVPMTLSYGKKSVSLIALKDTGNTLRDPVSGEQVLVVAGHIGERLTGLTQEQMRHPLETLARHPIPGLRLIPYRAVGQSGSMLLGLRMERINQDGRRERTVVAFAPEGMDRGAVYQALVGGV